MAVEFGSESQVESSQRMYDGRAPTYEDSWHPDYSARFVKAIPLKPGDRVLDFCCGNGLEAFLAADIVGDEGDVVGVDISKGMLEQLLMRQRREPELGSRIKVFRNDVTNLDALSAQVAKGSFDVILCSNAFVLFDDPAKVVAHWREYLKPGGIMAVDITHEHNLRAGKVLELVARRLGVKFPSNRAWVTSQETFKELLEKEGLEVENVVLLEKVMGQEPSYYRVDQADEQYDYVSRNSPYEGCLAGIIQESGATPKLLGREGNTDQEYRRS